MNSKDIIKFRIGDKPYSADPIDYDYFIHHQVFRSVLGSLVSVYSKGNITPFLAENWDHSDNKKTWTFLIRKGLLFDNGDEITPKIIANSFCRMAYLQKKLNSNSGLLEHLIGFSNITDINSCEGIQFSKSAVTFSFVKPIENLLETISFGQYSVVHPSDYDENGEWKNVKNVISSSFYKVSEWGEHDLKLNLRSDFLVDVGHPNKADVIIVAWNDINDFDIKTSSSLVKEPEGFHFVGGPNSNMAFLRVSSWNNKKFPLSDKNFRVRLRTMFYDYLIKQKVKPVTSFFPTSIEGIEEIPYMVDKENAQISSTSELKFAPFRDSPGGIADYLADAATESGLKIVNPSSEEKYQTLDPDLSKYAADVLAMGTGILIDKPDDDVRYMFLSKEGIRLPDETGEIFDLLREEKLNLQKINKHIFDQALIWPLAHYSNGIVINERIDDSLLNSIHPPIDFSFIGIK